MTLRHALLAAVICSTATAFASDYVTHGVDPGRTGWIKDEKVFTKANVGKMKLLWKVKLESTPREMHNLFNPLILGNVTTARARVKWRSSPASPTICSASTSPRRAGVEKELRRCPQVQGGRAERSAPAVRRPYPSSERAPRPGSTRFMQRRGTAGCARYMATGQDVDPPEKFLPGNGKPYTLNLVNGVIYTASAQGCGGNPNAFYSFDLATKKASIFLPAGGGLWGRRGAAVDPEGRVFMGTGDARFDPTTRNLGNGIVAVKLDENNRCSSWISSRRRTPTGCSGAIST